MTGINLFYSVFQLALKIPKLTVFIFLVFDPASHFCWHCQCLCLHR